MRITCPNCAATYDVPQSRLHPHRSVKCSRCDTVWRPLGQQPSAMQLPIIEPPVIQPSGATGSEPKRAIATDSAEIGFDVSLPPAPERAPEAEFAEASQGLPASAIRATTILASDPTERIAARPDLRHRLARPGGDQRSSTIARSLDALNTDAARLRAAWIGSIIIVMGAVFAVIHWRATVMEAWPASGRLLSIFDTPPAPAEVSDSGFKTK
jgi:predicted Zn finger-like uncharacterized protein